MRKLFRFLLRCLCGLIRRYKERHVISKCDKALQSSNAPKWYSKILKLEAKYLAHDGDNCLVCSVIDMTLSVLGSRLEENTENE